MVFVGKQSNVLVIGSKVPKSRESVGDNVVGLSSIALSLSLTRDPTESTGSAAAVEALETPSARKRKVVRYFVDHDISSKCYRCGKMYVSL